MAKHDLGDMERIRVNLQSWLSARLEDATDLQLDELKFPEESGESSVTLLLNAHYNGKTERFVCRMKPVDSQVFDSHDLSLQFRLMEVMHDNGVPAPGLLGYEADESLVGSDFYIMTFTDGQIPIDNPPYAFGSWVTELSAHERSTMWRNGIATLARIHTIDIARYNLDTLPRPEPGESPIQHEIRKFEGMTNESVKARMDPKLAEAFDYVKANVPADGPLRLCWGDSRPGNVIWRKLTPVAVIDWEMANLGDPMQDISWWFWIDHVNSVGLGIEMLEGLPQINEVYEQWHEITGLPIDKGDYYNLWSVVRYALIMERKLIAMEAAGIEGIGNFVVPFVETCLAVCQQS